VLKNSRSIMKNLVFTVLLALILLFEILGGETIKSLREFGMAVMSARGRNFTENE
jgi:hypothetical protein